MALPFDRRRQLELEAEAELELEQEQQQRSLPFASAQESQLGADYKKGYSAQIGEALGEVPEAAVHMAKDAFNLVSPYDTKTGWQVPIASDVIDAGLDKTARTVGPLALGTAGAMAAAPFGAWAGPLGMAGFGAAGFGAGLLGFDVVKDLGLQAVNEIQGTGEDAIRPASEYAKDAIYNTTQAGAFNAVGALAAKAPAVKAVTKPFTKQGNELRVGQNLNERVGGVEVLDRALAEATASGVPPELMAHRSLGEILDNPVLKSEQRALARGGSEQYGRAAEAYRARNDAQLKYLDALEQGIATADDAAGTIKRGLNEQLANSEARVATARARVDDAITKLPESIDLQEAGGVIVENVAKNKEALQRQISQKFDAAGDGVVDPAPAKAVAQELMPKYFKEVGAQPNQKLLSLLEDLNREAPPSTLLDASGNPISNPATYTLRDVQAMRSKALEVAQGGDRRSAAVASQIAEALKLAESEAVKAGTVSAEQISNLDAGRALRKQMGVDYESSATPTKSVLSPQSYGELKTPVSVVPGKYFKSGRGAREAAQNYKTVAGATEAALEPIHRYAADTFRKQAVDANGNVNTARARRWLEQHAEALQEFPELAQQFGTVEKAQTFLNERFGDLKRTQAEVESGALSLWLKDVEPKAAIAEMLKGDKAVQKTVATTSYIKSKGDKAALSGLRRGVIDYLKESVFEPNAKVSLSEAVIPGGPMFDGLTRDAMLGKTWLKIRPAVERAKLFTEDQMRGFDYLYKDKASQLSIEKAKMPSGSDTVQNFTTLSALSKIASNSFLRGYPTTRAIVSLIEPIIRSIPQGKFITIMEEALLNPMYARELMAKATAKNITKTASQIFKDEMAKVTGPAGAMDVAGAAAGAAMRPPQEERKPEPPPKQQKVTAGKSFPKPNELLRPATPGKPQKVDLSQYSNETKARVMAESSGNPNAISPKGARGLSQLMDPTAEEIAAKRGETYMPLRPGMTEAERQASIRQNIQYGDIYYQQQLRRFKNETLARAAYNAGPRRVQEAIKLAGGSRNVNKVLSNLPPGVQKETIPYTEKISEIMQRLNRGG